MLTSLRHQTRSRFSSLKGGVVAQAPLLLLGFLVALPLGAFLWLLFATNTFTVTSVTVVDARAHTEALVRKISQSHVIPDSWRGVLFFFPLQELESQILQQVPQIRTVHITRILPSGIKVLVQEKQPALILITDGAYYLVDDTGTPYEEARIETLPGVVIPTVRSTNTADTVVLGAPAIDPKMITLVRSVQKELPEILAAQVVEVRIPSLAAHEAHVRLSHNWDIKFDTNRSVTTQLAALERVVAEVITAEEVAVLEYIDLRIPNRVYYRIRGAVSETALN